MTIADKTDKTEKAKTVEVAADDLMVVCACRKVAIIVRGGKRELRNLEVVTTALRDSCTLACGCRVMLANVARKPVPAHD